MLATKEVPNGTAVERQDPCKMDREMVGARLDTANDGTVANQRPEPLWLKVCSKSPFFPPLYSLDSLVRLEKHKGVENWRRHSEW